MVQTMDCKLCESAGFDDCDCAELGIIAAEYRREQLADIVPCPDDCDCHACECFRNDMDYDPT